MGKRMKRKIASILLAMTMVITILPVSTKADEKMAMAAPVTISDKVDYQEELNYSEYLLQAFTNHSFDSSVVINNADVNNELKVSVDNVDYSDKLTTDDGINYRFIIPQNDIANMDKETTHTIKYELYDGADCIASRERYFKVNVPHFEYKSYFSGGECHIDSQVILGNLCSIGYGIVYDWEHPSGGSSDSVKATSVDVVNDDSTPNAFVKELKDDYVSVKAVKTGHATIKINYSKLQGYVDDNKNGCCILDYMAKDEIVSIEITSTQKNATVTAGEQFDLKAKATSSYMTGFGSCTQETERNITYNWFGGLAMNSGFNYEIDKKDPSICHIKVSDVSTDQTVYMYLTYSYIDSEGKTQTNTSTENYAPLSYGIKLAKCYYKLECEVPDKIAVGEKAVIKPVLKKYSAEGESVIPNVRVYCNEYSNCLSIQENSDYTLTVLRNYEGDADFNLMAYGYDAHIKLRINSSETLYQFLQYTNRDFKFDGVHDLKFGINIKQIRTAYDDISLYLGDFNNNKICIDKSYYTSKKVDDIIYYTVSSKFLKKNSNYYTLSVVVSNKGTEIASTNENYIYDYTHNSPFQIWNGSIIVNNRQSIDSNNIYTIDGIGYDCTLDSIKEEGNNILNISKNKDEWQYYATKAGTTNINSYYHYFKNGKRVDAITTSEIVVEDYTTNFLVESDDNRYDKFTGSTVYYYLYNYKVTYDKEGKQQRQIIPENYRVDFEIGSFTTEGVKVTKTMVSNSCVKLDIAADSGEGNVTLTVGLYDSNNKYMGGSSTGFAVHNKTYRRGEIDEIYYNSDEPWNVKVKPYVREYSRENIDGKDVSSEYSLSINCEKDGVTAVTKNSDGSYTLCNYENNKNVSNRVNFTWTPNALGDRETLTDWYPIEPGSFYDQDMEIKREQSLTLIDGDTLGFNIYWSTKNVYGAATRVKVTIAGENNNSWYVDLKRNDSQKNNDGYEHYISTFKLNSGQMAKNIKVQLLYPGNNVVLDEFTTSVASYAKQILDSNDSSYTKYKPLIKAMLNYGTASQSYFDYSTNNMANSCLSSGDKVVNDIPQNDIDRFNINKKFHMKGLSYYGTSLILGDKITMRYYFKLEDGRDIINYYAEIYTNKDGSSYGREYKCEFKQKNDLYYIETTESTKSIFEKPDIRISDGYDMEYFLYSPMNYVAKAYIKGNMDPKLKNLLNAMYWMEKEKSKLG